MKCITSPSWFLHLVRDFAIVFVRIECAVRTYWVCSTYTYAWSVDVATHTQNTWYTYVPGEYWGIVNNVHTHTTGSHSNQHPPYTLKPIYNLNFTYHIRSWLLRTPVIVYEQCQNVAVGVYDILGLRTCTARRLSLRPFFYLDLSACTYWFIAFFLPYLDLSACTYWFTRHWYYCSCLPLFLDSDLIYQVIHCQVYILYPVPGIH